MLGFHLFFVGKISLYVLASKRLPLDPSLFLVSRD